MSRFIFFLGLALVVNLGSCKSRSPVEMSRDEVEAKLVEITGLDIPAAATNVSGEEVSMFTYVFDCQFDCPLADFKEAWGNTARLADQVPVAKLVPVEGLPREVFEGKWPADGGTQFVNITLGKLDEDRVRVEVRTTHEQESPKKTE